MKTTGSLGAATLAVVACLALASCDRDTANRAENAASSAGQKIDQALDKTQQKLAEAGEKISETAQRAAAGMKDAAAEGSRSTATTTTTTGSSTTTVSTGERTSLTGISPETRGALSDTAITASIQADYLKDPDLSVLKIDVDTNAGRVTLNGTAESDAARKRAEQIAGAIKGVKSVRNNLTVKRG